MDLDIAEKRAKEILDAIRPYCIRAEIAGSVRRKKPTDIKDIEIVAIPDSKYLFALCDIVNKKWGEPSMGKFPSKYTKIRSAFSIDFFWTNADCWGVCFFIRTGSKDFSHRALGHWKKVSEGGKSEDCRLYDGQGNIMSTPEEADVFRLLKCKFVPPEHRK